MSMYHYKREHLAPCFLVWIRKGSRLEITAKLKVDYLNKGNSTKTFDRSITHYWEALDTHSFVKKRGKLVELQGVQDQKCQKERAISLEGNTFDPTLVKPKCVWKLYISCVKSYFLKKLEKKKLFCKSITLLLCLSESWTRDLRHSNPISYLKTMEAWMKGGVIYGVFILFVCK